MAFVRGVGEHVGMRAVQPAFRGFDFERWKHAAAVGDQMKPLSGSLEHDHRAVPVDPFQGRGAMLLKLTGDDLCGKAAVPWGRVRLVPLGLIEYGPTGDSHEGPPVPAIGGPERWRSRLGNHQAKGRPIDHMRPGPFIKLKCRRGATERPNALRAKVEEEVAQSIPSLRIVSMASRWVSQQTTLRVPSNRRRL
jgi:hypothetical protein